MVLAGSSRRRRVQRRASQFSSVRVFSKEQASVAWAEEMKMAMGPVRSGLGLFSYFPFFRLCRVGLAHLGRGQRDGPLRPKPAREGLGPLFSFFLLFIFPFLFCFNSNLNLNSNSNLIWTYFAIRGIPYMILG